MTSTARQLSEEAPSEPASASTSEEREERPAAKKPPPSRTWGRWIKRLLLLLVAAGIVAMIAISAMPKPVPVAVTTVASGPMTVTVDEDGRTRVKDHYVVSAPLAGELVRIELHAGDDVKEGDVLARVVPLAPPLLDDRSSATSKARLSMAVAAKQQAAAQLERAKASQAFAKSEEERARKLVESGALPVQELRQLELGLRTADADLASARFANRVAAFEVEMAKAALAGVEGKPGAEQQVDVPAPVAGKVLRVMRESAGAVQAGAPLLEVGDATALEIVVDVLTRDAVAIEPGAEVRIERWGGEPLEGRVRVVEPSAFTRMSSLGVEEQRVNVIIDLTDPPERWIMLGDGYRVEARIVVWRAESVLRVPASAVFRRGDGWALFAVEAGKAALRDVTIGQRNGREVEITGGLDAGATIVTHPGPGLEDGTEVVSRADEGA